LGDFDHEDSYPLPEDVIYAKKVRMRQGEVSICDYDYTKLQTADRYPGSPIGTVSLWDIGKQPLPEEWEPMNMSTFNQGDSNEET